MRLNTLSPAEGSKRRVNAWVVVSVLASVKPVVWSQRSEVSFWRWRTSRFRGCQMPLYRRLPKFGFTSRKAALQPKFVCLTWLK